MNKDTLIFIGLLLAFPAALFLVAMESNQSYEYRKSICRNVDAAPVRIAPHSYVCMDKNGKMTPLALVGTK